MEREIFRGFDSISTISIEEIEGLWTGYLISWFLLYFCHSYRQNDSANFNSFFFILKGVKGRIDTRTQKNFVSVLQMSHPLKGAVFLYGQQASELHNSRYGNTN